MVNLWRHLTGCNRHQYRSKGQSIFGRCLKHLQRFLVGFSRIWNEANSLVAISQEPIDFVIFGLELLQLLEDHQCLTVLVITNVTNRNLTQLPHGLRLLSKLKIEVRDLLSDSNVAGLEPQD